MQEFFGKNNFFIEFDKVNSTVEWELDFDIKNYGVRGIGVTIKKVSCSVVWGIDTDELTQQERDLLINNFGGIEYRNDRIEGTIEIDSTQKIAGKEWEVINELEFHKDGAITVGGCN